MNIRIVSRGEMILGEKKKSDEKESRAHIRWETKHIKVLGILGNLSRYFRRGL